MTHVCSQCGKKFNTLDSLRYHKRYIHGSSVKIKKKKKTIPAAQKKIMKAKRMISIKESLLKNMTAPERRFQELLEELSLNFIPQYQIGNKFFDFYLPQYNILIEIDGDYWHGNPDEYTTLNKTQKKVVKNDKLKDRLSEEKGFRLIRFWESEVHERITEVTLRLQIFLGTI